MSLLLLSGNSSGQVGRKRGGFVGGGGRNCVGVSGKEDWDSMISVFSFFTPCKTRVAFVREP